MNEKKRIDTTHLRGDFFGGLTAGVVALPLALAFGVQSGMGAIAGIYGAIALGVFAAWFGGTNTQISGPTGPMTVVSAVVIATEIELHGSLDAALGTIIAIFLLAGFLQIILGVVKVGQYIRYMPYPVVSGFMSGIGVIIIVLQIFPFLGHASPRKIPDIFAELPNVLPLVNWESVGLAMATILTIYLFPLVTKLIPSALVALLALTAISTFMGLDVEIIGNIPEGLPALHFDALDHIDFSDPMLIIIPALTLAALGTIDSLLTSIVADNMTKTQHNSNKELVGQGIGNMVAAVLGGIPGAGATMRTVININSGGKTRLSGVIHGVALLLVLIGAGVYASLIPLPVLAGILITVGIGIIDYKGLKHILHVPKSDAIVMLVVLIMTVFVDLLQAVAVGMVFASVLFMKKMSDISEVKSSVGSVDDFAHEVAWIDETALSDDLLHKVYIKHFDGPIFFGFASRFQQMTQALPEVEVVIMRMKKVPYIDQSGMYAIEDALMALRGKNILVLMTEIQEQPKDMLKRIGIVPNWISEQHLYSDFSSCIEDLKSGEVFTDVQGKDDYLWDYIAR
ncbi:MAG: SulP family inorganic anion transporter [Gammaproteobacteria bacterium]|jgi:sulfate permease, SulP family|nr:SulP family inorganic anion transporter [Gammaproteobacteria bacterium]MBT5222364.1 SulP family inorganic anion transporter [Gammaproteobacteria bacterium]MBT5826134.1 SulP family inorganic anion transporter [Gammaproteobacteria bacterium]MBT5965971.1 SulP family inorganic anion transporter [Gammaproteobacteria bacterium]MBT6418789.1 SulP family inorganic anion transporter [Gammaproteobacteria bacterium]